MEVLRYVTIKAILNKINMEAIWESLKEEGNTLAGMVRTLLRLTAFGPKTA